MTDNDVTDPAPRLASLGDAIEHAAADDLRTHAPRPARRRRLVLLAATLAVVLVSGVAYAAVELISNEEIAASLPAGTLWLAGTEPTCTVVTQDVEYHCVLANNPSDALDDWMGTVEPTVDSSKHVNGGCRSLASDGKEWQCYIGQAAVDEQIIGQDFLGEYAPEPGVG